MYMEYLKQSAKLNEIIQKKEKKNKHLDAKTIKIVEDFIVNKRLVCYGGTAINNILPKDLQFYNYDIDIPDYDFFSPNAMEDAKELCDIYNKEGYAHVEAKSAFFYGTYKVFVNYIPIADITQIHEKFYKYLVKKSITINKIKYTNPDFLRMSLHQELSRPYGDVSRWEKIYDRMTMLNKYFPYINKRISNVDDSIQRKLVLSQSASSINDKLMNLFFREKTIIMNLKMVLCIYKNYMTPKNKKLVNKRGCHRSFSKYNDEPFLIYEKDIVGMRKKMKQIEPSLSITKEESKYKFIKSYYLVKYNAELIGIIFDPDSCVAYNEINSKKHNINIANLDTLLHLYFSLILIEFKYIDKENIYFSIVMLYQIIQNYDDILKNRSVVGNKQLSRFNLPCDGIQQDYQSILKQRNQKYKTLKNKKTSKEYKAWFFKYTPRKYTQKK